MMEGAPKKANQWNMCADQWQSAQGINRDDGGDDARAESSRKAAKLGFYMERRLI